MQSPVGGWGGVLGVTASDLLPAVCTHAELVVPRPMAPFRAAPEPGLGSQVAPEPGLGWACNTCNASLPHRPRPGPACSGHPGYSGLRQLLRLPQLPIVPPHPAWAS